MASPYPQPVALPAPLYVRLAGPVGTKVTIYRGGASPQTLPAPCIVGFRPGYCYRVELAGMESHPGLVICPSLEVIGSLRGSAEMLPKDHPATLLFGEEDVQAIAAGAVVTKVVLLERPETAVPVATKSELPLEIVVPPSRNPFVDAQERGRPLLVMQVGGRQYAAQELECQGVPGTVLLPGEAVLPPPRDPPSLPWMCYSLMDPVAGPSCPSEEVCFHDGGDGGRRAGIGQDGRLVGLDPSDTLAEYNDSRGQKKIAVSNRVCFCVPRYLVMKSLVGAAANIGRTSAQDAKIARAAGKAETAQTPVLKQQQLALTALESKQKASGIVDLHQTQVTARMEGMALYANAAGTGRVTGQSVVPELQEVEKPLIIIKWPDKTDPQLGEMVTFFIRYKNQGQRAITGIVVSDSLTTRLEYVAGSARTDRDALFTVTPNEANSSIVRWEVTGSLEPGQAGTVTFQARVR
jgi:uncharacterized repeat protein (TIGR01451 family)